MRSDRHRRAKLENISGTVRHASIEVIFVPGEPVEMSYQPSITAGSSDIELSLISELHRWVSATGPPIPPRGAPSTQQSPERRPSR